MTSASRKACLVVLGAAVLAGGWLRFVSLGRLSPWDDEFPHMIAGRALVEHGTPELPSGRSYRRALAQTVAVGGAMKLVPGEDEAAARLPSAVVGTATIPLVFLVARRRFGHAAALVAAAAVAVSPLHVAHSRSARFYTAFALAYACAAFFGTRALRTGRPRPAAAALVSFAVAVHLQSLALLIVAPFAVDAALQWRRAASSGERRRARAVVLGVMGIAAVAGAVAVALVATDRGDGVVAAIRRPVPGIVLDPAVRLHTFGRLFTGIFPWAWLVLGPAAVAGLRRAGRDGAALALHAALPALGLSILYRRIGAPRGIDVRYLLHLRLLLALVAGAGIAALVNAMLGDRLRSAAAPIVAAVVAAAVVPGIGGVAAIPGEGHPGSVIPRANWRAAAATVRAGLQASDGLLTTSPLASSWYLGRCGTWLRSRDAAAPYVDGGRDVYCGAEVVPDFAAVRSFMGRHARGWVLADGWWETEVDASVRQFIEARARRVPVPDATVLVYRWGAR